MTLKKFVGATMMAVALSVASQAQAVILTITGDTTGKPTFTRPVDDLSVLSAAGIGVHYDVFNFTVGTSGNYTFLTTGMFDTFSFLYSPSFSAATPLTNALIGNDELSDLFSLTTSGFAYSLVKGSSYALVTTGFSPSDVGFYSVTIGGPGTIAAVPEPQTYALMAAGLALLVVARRRREGV